MFNKIIEVSYGKVKIDDKLALVLKGSRSKFVF